ncbi:MAG: hypothetical protein A3I66_13270 [Burkholderiales bacterium RIFCSPLOWO2_02_FULL_57_36]|nr:MAG: hypothetical protein A3I66_13270 [Burkholderiales bacterium RIFCSPLOWO2_02_FULL_57_36]
MDEGLIERLKSKAASSPGGFRGKVLVVSGMVNILMLAAVSTVALLVYFGMQLVADNHDLTNLVYVGLTVLVLIGVVAILRMFFIRLEAPEGRLITRSEAPRLFETLDKMCKKLDGPPLDHVLITRDYNATILPLRTRASFGGYTNYLMLGLPYMLAVPAKEMLSAIARDYGYLCGTHGRLATKVYRQSRTFAVLSEQIQRKSDVGRIGTVRARLLNIFMAYYKAHTIVFLRHTGLAAEAASTKMFGPQIRANGLVRDALLGRWIMEEFWPKLMKQAESSPRPAFMPFAAMRTAFDASYEQWATRERLTEAWLEMPAPRHIHLSLRERVEAIGQPGMLPAQVKVTAAAALLEDATKRIIEEFDQAWWTEEKKNWDVKFHNASRSKSPLHDLSDFKLQDQKELASLRAEFDSLEAAKPVLEDLLKQPGGPFPKAAYLYGRILLDEDNDLGLEHLTVAAENDHSLAKEAAHAGYFYLLKKHGDQAAQDWWEKFVPTPVECE